MAASLIEQAEQTNVEITSTSDHETLLRSPCTYNTVSSKTTTKINFTHD